MRILHVIATLAPRYGGPPKDCFELCRELARRGDEVAIYTTNIDGDGDLEVPLEEPQRVEGVEIRYFPGRWLRAYAFSLPLARALRVAIPRYDIVHIHALYLFSSLVAAHYCQRFGVPYLVKPHGVLDPYLYRRHRGRKWIYEMLVERRNLRRAAAIHFTTVEERELTRPLRLKTPGVVVPIGVDLEEYGDGVPGAFREAWPQTHGKIIILFLGRLNFKKGLDLLAHAFGPVGRQRDDVHLVLAGPEDAGYGARVRRWLEAEGVARKVTFTGMLLGADKLSAFRAADLFVLPSYSENFGLSVVEALACEVPVVISNKVNIWREVEEAQAGLVVDCEAGALGSALVALLGDPVRRKAMGRRGRRLVEARFTWQAVGPRMTQVYREIVADGRRAE